MSVSVHCLGFNLNFYKTDLIFKFILIKHVWFGVFFFNHMHFVPWVFQDKLEHIFEIS